MTLLKKQWPILINDYDLDHAHWKNFNDNHYYMNVILKKVNRRGTKLKIILKKAITI